MTRYLPCLAAAALVALLAQFEMPVPGSPVPVSGQTLGVVLAGGWLGARRGALAIALYLLAGALGLPVFAGGGSGWQKFLGPTAGYLFGFLAGAGVTGALTQHHRRAPAIFGATLLGQALILALGMAWLARTTGLTPAWQQGVLPFLPGALMKSLLATPLIALYPRLRPDTAD